VREIATEEGKQCLRLRVAVDAGGCSGFQYTFELDDEELDLEEDVVYTRDGVEIVTDTTSLEYLEVTAPSAVSCSLSSSPLFCQFRSPSHPGSRCISRPREPQWITR